VIILTIFHGTFSEENLAKRKQFYLDDLKLISSCRNLP